MEWYMALALLLISAGVVMLVAEFFFPTGGLFVVFSLTCFASAVGLILIYGDRREAVASLLGLSIGLPIAGVLLFTAWKRLALKSGLDSESMNATMAQTPEIAMLEKLRGKSGRTISPMRPAGIVEFDGRRVDAMTEGIMIDENVWVKCVDIRMGTVIVRETSAPQGLSDLDLDELK